MLIKKSLIVKSIFLLENSQITVLFTHQTQLFLTSGVPDCMRKVKNALNKGSYCNIPPVTVSKLKEHTWQKSYN